MKLSRPPGEHLWPGYEPSVLEPKTNLNKTTKSCPSCLITHVICQ